MAILETPKWETITPELRHLLTWIGKQDFTNRFYLAGGTALSLQLGHRHSVDLDFFSENDEVHSRTREELMRVFIRRKSQIMENTDGDLLLLVDNIHVGFFSYGYPLLEPFLSVENVNLASLLDIGLMKLDAIIGRGARKDFYDLYYIARRIPLQKLLLSGKRKYPQVRDFALMAVEALLLFENADRDLQPEMLMEIPWNTVKQFFIEQGNLLGKEWFD
jgi:predicted nucleotidyltransferase component of viral defense system